jgi:hypothetical protein
MSRQNRTPHPARSKFENPMQLGGIRTGALDNGVRVAWIETGSGLRFLVALDRGGDIVDANFNQYGLCYLTPNGIKPPSAAYNSEFEWLRSWPGGLLTTCGPETIGGPRPATGGMSGLHGRYSNTPATLESVINPDPRSGQLDMILRLIIRDSRMFGPTYEIRREIRCTLGVPEIHVEDTVTNCSAEKAAHHWLYHCNLGYPLLDEGARFVYGGKSQFWELPAQADGSILTRLAEKKMNALKRVTGPLAEHRGAGERGLLVDVDRDRHGNCHIGLINPKIKLGLELEYPVNDLPRMANWQHYDNGCYATALEPFYGSLLGKPHDRSRMTGTTLAPGKSRKYRLTIRVHSGSEALKNFAKHDGPVSAE